jgi:hypothetical protein
MAGGVTLPGGGGWLPDPVAHLVAAAAGALWLRRRRTYLPVPGRRERRDDTDLQPLPTTVNAVVAATVEPASTIAPDAALTADALPPGALCLTGPGAHDAARGLLVTALLAAAHGTAAPQVIMTRPGLAALLGTTRGNAAGLQVVNTLDAALAALSSTTTATEAATPTCLLLAEPLRDPDRRRVEQAITGRTAVTAVMLAARPAHPTWHVAADGTALTPGDRARRLCVLNRRATTDLLSLLPPTTAGNTTHRRLPPTHAPADHAPCSG